MRAFSLSRHESHRPKSVGPPQCLHFIEPPLDIGHHRPGVLLSEGNLLPLEVRVKGKVGAGGNILVGRTVSWPVS